jgi:ABC-type phosphate transport system substrate-binding protein
MGGREIMIVRKAGLIALVFALSTVAWVHSSDPLLVNGAGATFPSPIYSKWFDEYHKLHPNIQINYQPVG